MVLIGFCTAYIDTHTRPCADKHAGRNIETHSLKKKTNKQKTKSKRNYGEHSSIQV